MTYFTAIVVFLWWWSWEMNLGPRPYQASTLNSIPDVCACACVCVFIIFFFRRFIFNYVIQRGSYEYRFLKMIEASDPLGLELPCRCYELNLGPLEVWYVLLATVPSLQACPTISVPTPKTVSC